MVGNPGHLRIETNIHDHYPAEGGDNNVSASLLSPSGRGRSASLTQNALPSLRISGEMPRSPVAENLSNMAMSQGIGKARNESRKLLAHILDQLKRRPMPPTLFRSLGNRSAPPEKSLDTVVRTVKVITAMRTKKSKRSNKAPEFDDSDEDFIDDREFHTDGTFDLLSQARDVLLISAAQRWDIFSDRFVFKFMLYFLIHMFPVGTSWKHQKHLQDEVQRIGHPHFSGDGVYKPVVRGRGLLHHLAKRTSKHQNYCLSVSRFSRQSS